MAFQDSGIHRSGYSQVVEDSFIPNEETDTGKALEIAAGARIQQAIHRDPERLDFWEPETEGIIYIHYVGQTEGKTIRSAGQIGTPKEGALSGLAVGN